MKSIDIHWLDDIEVSREDYEHETQEETLE